MKLADEQPKNWKKRFHDYAETTLHFLLTNITTHLAPAEHHLQAIGIDGDQHDPAAVDASATSVEDRPISH